MAQVIVPVGFNMGAQHRYVRPPDPQPECYEIHFGAEVIELSEDEASVYAFAFLDVERHAKLQVTREWLVRSLLTAPRPQVDAEGLVDTLLRRGLFLEFDPEGSLESVFRRFRLFPTGEGMGTTPEEPEYHRIGRVGQPLFALHNTAYTMWAFSFLHRSLWDACEYLVADDPEDEDSVDLTAQDVAREVAMNLPVMISTLSAFLDPVVEL